MSDRETRIRPRAKGIAHSLALHGRRTRGEMITRYRVYWQQQIDMAQRALVVPDEELIVETYLGPRAMRNREEVTS